MGNYTFNKAYITKPIDEIVEHINTKLKESNTFTGIGQGKKYTIIRVSPITIYYSGQDRNHGDPEEISIADLKVVLGQLKHLPTFNTNSQLLKDNIPHSLYRKRTPLFAILSHSGIIHEV